MLIDGAIAVVTHAVRGDGHSHRRNLMKEWGMMKEQRRHQRRAVQLTVTLILAVEHGETLAGPVTVELETLSLGGASVVLPSMQADGIHLFFECSDREGCCLVLHFMDAAGQRYAISCMPVWFDKELDKSPVSYRLGLEFFRTEDLGAIKLLDRIARGKAEKPLSEVLGDFFKRQLLRVS
jgi:hypothetical protein